MIIIAIIVSIIAFIIYNFKKKLKQSNFNNFEFRFDNSQFQNGKFDFDFKENILELKNIEGPIN